MGRVRMLMVLLAVSVAIPVAGVLGPTVRGQTPASAPSSPPAGHYDEMGFWVGANQVGGPTSPVMGPLQIFGDRTYFWNGQYSTFELTASGIRLQCIGEKNRGYTGTWSQQNGALEIGMRDASSSKDKRAVMGLARGRQPAVPSGAKLDRCAPSGSRDDARVVASLQHSLVLQEAERRVQGQLLLTLPGTPSGDDLQLWDCLTNRYPRVEFSATGAPSPAATPQDVFVWPDATFKVDVRGGTTYDWWLRQTGCRTDARVGPWPLPGGGLSAPATEEKIVLACFVLGGRIGPALPDGRRGCRAWWLVRP